MSMETLTTFLGWCTILNFGLLAFAAIMLVFMRGPIVAIHGKLMRLDETDLARAYFRYLANFKILVIVLNLVPYVALKLMA